MKQSKLSFHDRQHFQRMLICEQSISNIFDLFISSIAPDLKKWTATGEKNVWIRNAVIEKAIEKKLLEFQSNVLKVIADFQMDAWKRSNLKNDEFVQEYINGMSISETVKKGLFAQNLESMKQFQLQTETGFTLSDKVWNITKQTKTQFEFYLESGLSVGRNASTISQDIRQILRNPDKQFHRIWAKDENGKKTKLVMSKPMRNYHPGQGNYRSSRMNALRTAVTETNKMYRMADSMRWSKMDFVIGFEVNRSNNAKSACKICDPLVGKYPKGFIYTGWHPFCICPATPILLDPEEFAEYLNTDVIPEEKYISSVPQEMTEYLSQTYGDLNKAENLPSWVKINFEIKK